ncbi:MAG TPA: pilus assembly protein TadG-related protein [Nocardioidaceae bacterium]|nr:pilus assembly protein TadG-related protein [Nocardioidaceae bacterium]
MSFERRMNIIGRRHSNDTGQMSVMIVGFLTLLLLLAAVVVDVSAAYLRRTAMNNIADGAALAAADAVQGHHVYTAGLGTDAPIDATVAGHYVADYLATSGATSEYPGLRWQVVQDGADVRVTVRAPLDLALSVAGWGDDVVVTGKASAVVRVS